jgi:YVTN family beta-propeller protein
VGEKSKPMRIAIQPDGRYAWVGLDGSAFVAVIDTETNKLAATVPAGEGLHTIGFTSDSRLAYVTNSSADTVSAIDTRTFNKVSDIAVGKTPVPVAYSSASGLIYVAALNGESISVINPSEQQVIKSIPVKRGVVALRFDPSGRYGFAVNQVESVVSVIDASTNTIIGATEVVKAPDQVTFTGRYAYIRGTGSEKFSLLELSEVAKKGSVIPIDIQAGRLPASTLPQEIGVADMIVPTPEGNAVMVANTPDQMLYYYVEGMMAPMGTIQNYKRKPHALLLLDRSLSETAPGVYTTPVKLTQAGVFDVPMVIDQPRLVNCFELKIAESPDGKHRKAVASAVVEPEFKGGRFKSGEPVSLKFRITDPVTKQAITGIKDIEVLIFEPPGIWQKRLWAKEAGDGLYEITQAFPRAGSYNVMIRSASRGLSFSDVPPTKVAVN